MPGAPGWGLHRRHILSTSEGNDPEGWKGARWTTPRSETGRGARQQTLTTPQRMATPLRVTGLRAIHRSAGNAPPRPCRGLRAPRFPQVRVPRRAPSPTRFGGFQVQPRPHRWAWVQPRASAVVLSLSPGLVPWPRLRGPAGRQPGAARPHQAWCFASRGEARPP